MEEWLDKKKVIILGIILILIALIFLSTMPKKCNTNYDCFRQAELKCSKAKVTISENNTYSYEILGKNKNNCLIEITLLKLSENEIVELKNNLEGRKMNCVITKEILKDKSVKDLENINNYCTGPLKEAILEITINKMYEIIVKNIGPLASELRGISK